MSGEITREQLEKELREIVYDEPSRQALCVYVKVSRGEDNSETVRPECIVGQWAVRKCGLSPSGLIGDNGALVGSLLTRHGVRLTEEAQTFISIVQAAQDEKNTWGQALDIADGAMKRINSFA